MKYFILIFIAAIIGCSDSEAENDANNSQNNTQVDMEDDLTTPDMAPDIPEEVEYDDPFDVTVFDDIRISSLRDDENFQSAIRPLDFGDGPFASVIMKVNLDTTCFPFEKWSEDPPPEGHNFPPSCDAYDRNFEFVLDPALEDGDEPGFELVRAITPFGGPMEFEVDLTDLANAKPGAHDLRTRITTWSDGAGQVSGSAGGWNVTAVVTVTPGEAPRDVVDVVSVFNGNYRNDSGVVSEAFQVPDGVTYMRLDYTTTGHGGGTADEFCIGHADEFCQRNHFPSVNGRPLGPFVPWIDSCEYMCTLQSNGQFQFCLENPTGNVGSVRAPRANWCPGDITGPMSFDFDDPPLGENTFEFSVSGVADGGSWRTSATIYMYAEKPAN